MATRRAQPQQGQSLAPFILVAGVAGAGAAAWFLYPGVAVLWAAILITAWMEPPAIMTGKPDYSGMPQPANGQERSRLASYRFWSALRFNIFLPGMHWLPGWPVLGSWIAALVTAGAAAQLPVTEPIWRLANAGAAFLSVVGVCGTQRQTKAQGDSPGVRVDTLGILWREQKYVPITAGVVAVATSVIATLRFAAKMPDSITMIYPVAGVTVGVLIGLGILAYPWSTRALEHWRVVVAARAEWAPRWNALKMEPPPFLRDRTEQGNAVIDHFEATGQLPAMLFLQEAGRITPTIGAGSRIAILSVPDENADGPIPGTRHPLKFDLVSWKNGELDEFTDPELPEETALLMIHCGIAWAADALGYARMIPLSAFQITTPESELAVWAVSMAAPDGPPWVDMRNVLAGDISAALNAPVLVDHRQEMLYIGAIGDDGVIYQQSQPDYSTLLEQLETEDYWNRIWAAVLKQDANPPTIQHGQYAERRLADDRTVIYRNAWMVRLGIDPAEFRGLEPKLATAMQNIPFVTVTGWVVNSGDRQGERHPQAFATYWSNDPVPSSPEKLAQSPGAAWVLAGRINQAFDAAKIARPEIAHAEEVTKPSGRSHIWRIQLRLYGGVTLSDVRTRANRLREALGSTWLRVDEAPDGCVLYIGANPEKVELKNPRRDKLKLKSLDWAQAWIDSGVSGVNGKLPKLIKMEALPSNEQVIAYDFELPSGVDPSKVKEAVPKLCNSTGNEFIDVRPGDGASMIRVLASETNPLPSLVPFDFEFADRSEDIAFATGVEGEPITFRIEDAPHALLAGLTGSGKSYLAMMILYGALIKDWRCYVIDPVKGGADFAFAKDRCVAFAATPFEASGVMKAVYAEVIRRKNLNAQYGVGSYKDLPDDVRPHHIVVLIDEFTSLLGQSPLPPKSDDLTMNEERDAIEAENFARTEVGIYAGKLAREARSAGVTLLLGTQKLSAKMLDAVPGASDLRSNLARTLLGKASWGDMAAALRSPNDAPRMEGSIGKGRGLWEPVTSAPKIIQVWYASQEQLREALVQRIPELDVSERLDMSGFQSPLEASAHDGGAVQEVDLGELELELDDIDDFELPDDDDADFPLPTPNVVELPDDDDADFPLPAPNVMPDVLDPDEFFNRDRSDDWE